MTTISLELKKYKQEGDLSNQYNAFRNKLISTTSVDTKTGKTVSENQIVDFNTDELDIDLNNPLNIECQPSYDGTVNLIINDDKNPPRIINSRFSKLEDNRYKIINRNQKEQTNLYVEGKIDQQTRLFRNINRIPKIDLLSVDNTGQLMGGNYTFYIKFADNDYNKTDVVAESGQVSIFKGYSTSIKTISGSVFNERTDKSITLKISNIDTSFSNIYVYYTRESSDTNGFRITTAGMYTIPYRINSSYSTITINGFEEEQTLTPEEINIQYNIVTAAKTQAQVQNMLFFGNVQQTLLNVKDLQNISYYIQVQLKRSDRSIGFIQPKDYTKIDGDDVDQIEYYSTNNIYYNLGYWPDEIYRLGVVYILNDDSLTPVFNLRGHSFDNINESNFVYNTDNRTKLTSLYTSNEKSNFNYLERDDFLSNSKFLDNTFGVFQNPNISVINYDAIHLGKGTVNPLYYQMTLPNEIKEALSKLKVKGFFFVRQKRIPTSLCQALAIGVDRVSHIPMLADSNTSYLTESFLSPSYELVSNFDKHIIRTSVSQGSGLLCVDANVNPQLQSVFDGSDFILKPTTINPSLHHEYGNRHFYIENQVNNSNTKEQYQSGLVYIEPGIPSKYINGFQYSTKCGTAEDVSKFSFFSSKNLKDPTQSIVRGNYCGFIGTNKSLKNNIIYTVKVQNYSITFLKDYFSIRGKDHSPFYAISHRYELNDTSVIDCYRGDCYTNTVTIRINRNFIDSEVPINDTIIDSKTWKDNYKGYSKMKDSPEGEEQEKDDDYGYFSDINRADVNTVPLGMWVTYKCLSNYNLGLRSIDTSYTDEYALMGSPRGFYPATDMSVISANKIEESTLLNDGYCATVGQKRNFIVDNVPYIKDLFDNRIMFSNVQRDDDFQNAYRIFQGLSFKDIDRQYGAIVKLISYGTNLFCVFEHGLGIIPINEKALIQTSTNQSIHMYGAGVIQNQITLVSPDFGSIWQESIIRTPVGIYGVDTYAKKIWRYSDKGLETISDMKVQRFLNDKTKLREQDKYPTIALKNVKSHYNNFKGDVMFTFYNDVKDETWNLCYNERLNKWVTRYSWTPLYSENINNIFYSFDQDRAKILAYIYDNQNCNYGLRVNSGENQWNITLANTDFSATLNMVGYSLYENWIYSIDSIETGYLKNGSRTYITVPTTLFTINNNIITGVYDDIYDYFHDEYDIEIPVYFKINLTASPVGYSSENSTKEVLAIVVNNTINRDDDAVNAFLKNGIYVHGKAGIFNEMNYRDSSFNNEILPTKWYEKQEPFEFEFVVNDEVGLHKIFDNLVIISNNVQPNQIEYEIIGDVYKFNKTGIFRRDNFEESEWNTTYTKPKFIEWDEKRSKLRTPVKYQTSQEFYNCRVEWDDVLNQYSLITTQDCTNIEKIGRRLGNIQYKEDSWYITIDPIKYKEKYKIDDGPIDALPDSKVKEVRLRDKFIKIRVKYTGEDMVIITALKTILTPSYS